VTRRRSSAPGRIRPDRRRSLLFIVLPLVLAVAACGSTDATDQPSPGTPVPSGPSEPTPDTGSIPPTDEPTAEPTSEPTDEPTAEPTDDPDVTSSPGPAARCSGSDDNRDFFVAVAAAVTWPVYCADLPRGWFVEAGQYRLAGGGRMEITYRGPGSNRLTLREGAFCSETGGCVPAGTEIGDAAFGDQDGTLVALDDGGWAIIVDRGAQISWLALGTGLDESTFRAIGEALVRVGD
jgi:hypothetical protein